jgi:hypothetical protein
MSLTTRSTIWVLPTQRPCLHATYLEELTFNIVFWFLFYCLWSLNSHVHWQRSVQQQPHPSAQRPECHLHANAVCILLMMKPSSCFLFFVVSSLFVSSMYVIPDLDRYISNNNKILVYHCDCWIHFHETIVQGVVCEANGTTRTYLTLDRLLDGNAITSVPFMGQLPYLQTLFVPSSCYFKISYVMQIAVQQPHHWCGWQCVQQSGQSPNPVCFFCSFSNLILNF